MMFSMTLCSGSCKPKQNPQVAALVICFHHWWPPLHFSLANSDFLNGTHLQPLNLYTVSVGHPGTGKPPAIETVLAALRDVDTITKETLVSGTTSSGLVKTISKQGKAFVASPKLFDILNKLLKNDEDNATGDVQLLCKLWSGESASYHFATEAPREIESNTAFPLLGSTDSKRSSADF